MIKTYNRPTRRTFLAQTSLAAAAAAAPNSLLALSQPPLTQRAPQALAGPFQPTWESIRSNYRYPDWFRDAKFGIFLHWGLYSVPAHGSEWYVTHMYGNPAITQWHTEHFGPPARFGYKDFIPLFTASKWDPDQWARLFKKSGAQYIMPTAEHHDGFALWDSALTPWNAKRMGPRRDLIGDLALAVRKQGLKFGVSNHRMEHFDFIKPTPGLATDLNDPATADFYSVADRSPSARAAFLADFVARNKELIDKYQPDTLYFDNGVNPRDLDPQKLEVAAYYYNRAAQWGKQVSILTKADAYLSGSIKDYERQSRAPLTIQPEPFDVDDSVGFRWGYLTGDHYWDTATIVTRLIENVCRNGNLLLNFGPRADGTFDEAQTNLMLGIGQWLHTNGEAIYKSRPWTIFGEGPSINGKPAYTPADIRFTRKADTLYAILMAWPASPGATAAQATITSLGSRNNVPGKITRVQLLGHPENLQFTQTPEALTVDLPTHPPTGHAHALKITRLKLNA